MSNFKLGLEKIEMDVNYFGRYTKKRPPTELSMFSYNMETHDMNTYV